MTHNRISFFNLVQETGEHRLFIGAPIVAKAVLIEIGLQVAFANRMINATHAILDQAPEAFHGVRMDVANHVDLGSVVDSLMVVSHIRHVLDTVVAIEFIGKHGALRKNVFPNHAKQSGTFHIVRNQSLDATFALYNSHDGSFNSISGHRSARTAFPFASHVRFIHLHVLAASTKWRSFLVRQHGSNLLEHAPCGLVGNASLPLNLLRGDTASGLGHEVDRIKPSRERSGRLVKDRVGSRVNVMAAMIARVRRSAHNTMVLGHRFARFAIDTVWVEAITKPFKAGRVIRELALEIFQRVREHFRFAVVMGHDVYLLSGKTVAEIVPTVKG